jgi:hypothetical protein
VEARRTERRQARHLPWLPWTERNMKKRNVIHFPLRGFDPIKGEKLRCASPCQNAPDLRNKRNMLAGVAPEFHVVT